MATVSGIPAWRIPPREEPGGLPSMVFQSRTGLRDFHFHSFDGGCLFSRVQDKPREYQKESVCCVGVAISRRES